MPNTQPSPPKKAFIILNGADIYALIKPVTNLGRMEDNDVVLSSAHVSRYHAQIRRVGEAHLVVDLNSTSGTSVNGQPVSERLLSPGDVISLAGVPIIYGLTAGPGKLDRAGKSVSKPTQARKDSLGHTDAVDVGSIDRFLDLFDPPKNEDRKESG
ncbi:MAG TPA: FHA domain-containing protein [Anaerolineales bacterium]|nr:FHA domain-containing protein [Anaerolineales bacterium]